LSLSGKSRLKSAALRISRCLRAKPEFEKFSRRLQTVRQRRIKARRKTVTGETIEPFFADNNASNQFGEDPIFLNFYPQHREVTRHESLFIRNSCISHDIFHGRDGRVRGKGKKIPAAACPGGDDNA